MHLNVEQSEAEALAFFPDTVDWSGLLPIKTVQYLVFLCTCDGKMEWELNRGNVGNNEDVLLVLVKKSGAFR